ncbi:MAG: pyridoxamine 5'-phosphate oxidase family protein [Eubacteriales bacterium]|nr:pyridoxamine 5'-phosphate oxidase family protein [Eubacteriales bacterium]
MTRRELEVTDLEEIRQILEKCKVLHLGLVDDGMPYIVPMNFGYRMEEEKLTLILHCAVKGYKLDVIAKNPQCCFEMECDVQGFEGRVPCQYGTSYSCLMGRGKVQIVETAEEKIDLMTAFMKSQTGQEFEFNERLLSVVTMLKIDVSEYTAKKRPLPNMPANK